jgi:hypothetical protein
VFPVVAKMEKSQEVCIDSWSLPVVRHGSTSYFVDLCRGQFRDISDSGHCVDFDSDKGRLMCEQTHVIVCPDCGAGVIVSPSLDVQKLRCVQCFSLIVPLFAV